MSTCRSCGTEIIWAVTEGGKRMPLDDLVVFEVPNGLFRLDSNWPGDGENPSTTPSAVSLAGTRLYRSHFATCPDAAKFRKAS